MENVRDQIDINIHVIESNQKKNKKTIHSWLFFVFHDMRQKLIKKEKLVKLAIRLSVLVCACVCLPVSLT